jgi:hypothetical protein
MIGVNSSGSTKNIESFLKKMSPDKLYGDLDHYGRLGVEALRRATPSDSGLTARSWEYKVIRKPPNIYGVEWLNTNTNDGTNVALLIQYGHGTGTGGYVVGLDYINPALHPIFEEIANDIWKKVNRA